MMAAALREGKWEGTIARRRKNGEISSLAERGAPLTDIQKILGHERPTTTIIIFNLWANRYGQRWGF